MKLSPPAFIISRNDWIAWVIQIITGDHAPANFIEGFYYGNMDPQTMGKNERQIQKVMKLPANNTADNFINGFRLGAKFAYDTFVGADHLVIGSRKGA